MGGSGRRSGRPLELSADELVEKENFERSTAELIVALNALAVRSDLSHIEIRQSSKMAGDAKWFSRTIRKRDGPPWHFVESFVDVCLRKLGEPIETGRIMYEELWRRTPTGALLETPGPPRRPTADVGAILDGAEFVLSLLWDGRESEAAVALDRYFGENAALRTAALIEVTRRDPAAVAELLVAIVDQSGPVAAREQYRHLVESDPELAKRVLQAPRSVPIALEPESDPEPESHPERLRLVDLDPTVGIARRWAALLRRGDIEQVLLEILARARDWAPPDDGSDGAKAKRGLVLIDRQRDLDGRLRAYVEAYDDRPGFDTSAAMDFLNVIAAGDDGHRLVGVLLSAMAASGYRREAAACVLWMTDSSAGGVADWPATAATVSVATLAHVVGGVAELGTSSAYRQKRGSLELFKMNEQHVMAGLPVDRAAAVLVSDELRGLSDYGLWRVVPDPIELIRQFNSSGKFRAAALLAQKTLNAGVFVGALADLAELLRIESQSDGGASARAFIREVVLRHPVEAAQLLHTLHDTDGGFTAGLVAVTLEQFARVGVELVDAFADLCATEQGLPQRLLDRLAEQTPSSAEPLLGAIAARFTPAARHMVITGFVGTPSLTERLLQILAGSDPTGPWRAAEEAWASGDHVQAAKLLIEPGDRTWDPRPCALCEQSGEVASSKPFVGKASIRCPHCHGSGVFDPLGYYYLVSPDPDDG